LSVYILDYSSVSCEILRGFIFPRSCVSSAWG